MEIGHDTYPGAGIKHYRRYYPEELENVIDILTKQKMVDSPFLEEEITRARDVNKKSFMTLFGGHEGAQMVSYEVGKFKGMVRVYEESVAKENLDEMLNNINAINMCVKAIY